MGVYPPCVLYLRVVVRDANQDIGRSGSAVSERDCFAFCEYNNSGRIDCNNYYWYSWVLEMWQAVQHDTICSILYSTEQYSEICICSRCYYKIKWVANSRWHLFLTIIETSLRACHHGHNYNIEISLYTCNCWTLVRYLFYIFVYTCLFLRSKAIISVQIAITSCSWQMSAFRLNICVE